MRARMLALVVLAIVALAPLTAVARTARPVLTSSFTGLEQDHIDGSSCADLTYANLVSDYAASVTADEAMFGFASNAATNSGIEVSYISTAMGQRIYSVEFWAYSDSDIYESEFDWHGVAALKCLPDGSLQFNFKPSGDYYYDQYNPDTGYYVSGNLGGNARVTVTVDLANSAVNAAVYAPVTLRQTWDGYE